MRQGRCRPASARSVPSWARATDAGGSAPPRRHRPLRVDPKLVRRPSAAEAPRRPSATPAAEDALHVLPRPVIDRRSTRARGPTSSTDAGRGPVARDDQRGAAVGGEAGVGHRSPFVEGPGCSSRSPDQNRTVHPARCSRRRGRRARARSAARPLDPPRPLALVAEQPLQLRAASDQSVAQSSPGDVGVRAVEAAACARRPRRPGRGRRPAAAPAPRRRPATSSR